MLLIVCLNQNLYVYNQPLHDNCYRKTLALFSKLFIDNKNSWVIPNHQVEELILEINQLISYLGFMFFET